MDTRGRTRRRLAPALAGVLLLAACTPGASAAREEAAARAVPAPAAPSFDPDPDATPDTPSAGPGPDAADTEPTPAAPEPAPLPAPSPSHEAGAAGGTEEQPAAGSSPDPALPSAVSPTVSSVDDPRGDTRQPVLGREPAAADLIRGEIRSDATHVAITIELGAPPEPDRSTTLNVASFHDLTGDGSVDLEVWANHSDAGWFPSWRDNRVGRAAYGSDSGIAVTADGATVTLSVPVARFGDPTSWRWALGLEWGRYEWLGTQAAARDEAPDDGYVTHRP